MKKHILTATTVVFAIGSAFAGSRVATGWYLNTSGTGTSYTDAQITTLCPNGSTNPCAYHFTSGGTTYDKIRYYSL